MRKNIKKRVIVIGGGYGGISLLHELKKNKNLELLLIDKSQVHLLQTHLHKYLSGHYDKSDITFNHEKYCKENNIKFICDEVTKINYKQNYLISRQNNMLHYDYIVIATGSVSIFPKSIENIIEYTRDIKNIDSLEIYRNQFLKLINTKSENKNIIVIGGGISGVQIACEYAQTIKSKNINTDNVQVTIIEGLSTILPGMNSFLIEKAQKRCDELGIKVVTKLFASKILEDTVILSNEQILSYDMLIFVIGSIGNSFETTDDTVLQNKKNQLIVDKYYNVSPHHNAFAIGDITQAIDVNKGSLQSQTAQAARMQAILTAKNINRKIEGKTLIENNISNKGVLIDLGGTNCAVGRLFSFNLSGILALWAKKIIYSLHAKKFN